MGNFETFEAPKAAESRESNLPNLSSYFMESPIKLNQNRADVVITDQDVKDRVRDMHLVENQRTGESQNNKQLRDAGVTSKHTVSNDNTTTVTSEFPSGVVVKTENHVSRDGSESANIRIEVKPPAHRDQDGNIVDKNGRVLTKNNPDGSVTVDAGNGKFYTQYYDGSIRLDKGQRSPDGKTFTKVDTRQADAEKLVREHFYNIK